ncbi:MAG: hypothetical protein LUF04_08995 [Bacteroides sp.]|nr:hypothetical protein [Bacteroides sp.]
MKHHTYHRFLSLFTLVVIWIGCACTLQAHPAQLRGVVSDPEGRPLAGAPIL